MSLLHGLVVIMLATHFAVHPLGVPLAMVTQELDLIDGARYGCMEMRHLAGLIGNGANGLLFFLYHCEPSLFTFRRG